MRPALVLLLNAVLITSQMLCLAHLELPNRSAWNNLDWARPHFHPHTMGTPDTTGVTVSCSPELCGFAGRCHHEVLSNSAEPDGVTYLPDLLLPEDSLAKHRHWVRVHACTNDLMMVLVCWDTASLVSAGPREFLTPSCPLYLQIHSLRC